ncbi:MAG: hypothetical protein HQ523_16070 [Lentisphaerae bacterium]|nr:hypothetical protein [Lentisphaerota bacterium]
MTSSSPEAHDWSQLGLLEPSIGALSATEEQLDYAWLLRKVATEGSVKMSGPETARMVLSLTVMPSLSPEQILFIEEVSRPGSIQEYRVRHVRLAEKAWNRLREHRSKHPKPFASYPEIGVEISEASLPSAVYTRLRELWRAALLQPQSFDETIVLDGIDFEFTLMSGHRKLCGAAGPAPSGLSRRLVNAGLAVVDYCCAEDDAAPRALDVIQERLNDLAAELRLLNDLDATLYHLKSQSWPARTVVVDEGRQANTNGEDRLCP